MSFGIDIVEGHIEGVEVDDDHLHGIHLADGRIIARDVLFVPRRFLPNNDVLVPLGCALTMPAGS